MNYQIQEISESVLTYFSNSITIPRMK